MSARVDGRRRRARAGRRASSEPSIDRRRQLPAVARLLAAEPDRQELGVVQLAGTRSGRQRVGRGAQPVERRLRRGERDLLLEDQVDECREPGRAIPERRRAPAPDDRRQVGVARGQLGDRERQRGLVERDDAPPARIGPTSSASVGRAALAARLERRQDEQERDHRPGEQDDEQGLEHADRCRSGPPRRTVHDRGEVERSDDHHRVPLERDPVLRARGGPGPRS